MLKLNVGRISAFVLLLCTFLASPLVYAIPLGSAATDFGGTEGARSVAVRPDGKIIVGGYSYAPNGFALARYHPDGRLDTTFGTDGAVIISDFFGDPPEGMEVRLDGNGNIVIAGFTGDALNFAVARYTGDGIPDSSFGSNGKVMTNLTGSFDYDLAYTLAIQSDNKIILGGFCDGCGATPRQDFALVRYNQNGTLDTTFGSGGVVLTDFNNGSDDRVNALYIMSDGRILAGGRSANVGIGGAGRLKFALARYNSNGTLDPTFGTGGLTTYEFEGTEGEVRALAITSRGKILAVGPAGINGDFTVVRFNEDGTLDTRYASNGVAYADFGTDDQASAAILQADGKLLAGGYANDNFAVARFNENGSLDSQFGTAGKVSTYLGSSSDFAMKLGMALQSGKIITAGTIATNNSNFGLIRYTADGIIDNTFGPRTDLVISNLTATPNPVKAANNLTYTFIVTNQGLEAVPSVSIVHQHSLPVATVSCTQSCNLGNLASGASVTVTLVVTPLETGTLATTINANSPNVADPIPTNNAASINTTVNGAADLSLSHTANPSAAKINENVTFTAVITNNGPDSSANANLSITGFGGNLVSVTTTQGSCSGEGSINCSIGIIASGNSVIVRYVTKYAVNGTYASAATVSGIADPNTANNSQTASITVNSSSDLALNVTASPDPIRVGNTLTYTVTVTNLGPDAAEPIVRLRDFPDFNQVIISPQATPNCHDFFSVDNNSRNNLYCTVGIVAGGSSVSFTVPVTPIATGTLSMRAIVSIDSNPAQDPNSNNNTLNVSSSVTGSADISVTIVGSPSSVRVGNSVTYTTTITNSGPDTAYSVYAYPRIPNGSAGVSITPSQGNCDPFSTSVSTFCSLGHIASGASVTVTSIFIPKTTGNLAATTDVASYVDDPNTSNNSYTVSTTVTGAADLFVSVTDSPDPIRVGNNVTYQITVTNGGPDFATNARLSSALPAGVTFVSASSSVGYCLNDTGIVTCNFGTLNSGVTATVDIVGTVNVRRTTLSNTVSVSSDVADPNTANNSATALTTVQ